MSDQSYLATASVFRSDVKENRDAFTPTYSTDISFFDISILVIIVILIISEVGSNSRQCLLNGIRVFRNSSSSLAHISLHLAPLYSKAYLEECQSLLDLRP
jgi:hypothetical protein